MKKRKIIFIIAVFLLFISFFTSAFIFGMICYNRLQRYGYDISHLLTLWMCIIYSTLFISVIATVLTCEILLSKKISKSLSICILSLGFVNFVYSICGMILPLQFYIISESILISAFIVFSTLWFIKLFKKSRNQSSKPIIIV